MPSSPCKTAAEVGRVSSLTVFALASTSLALVNSDRPTSVLDGV